jgi:hypothetical protein
LALLVHSETRSPDPIAQKIFLAFLALLAILAVITVLAKRQGGLYRGFLKSFYASAWETLSSA